MCIAHLYRIPSYMSISPTYTHCVLFLYSRVYICVPVEGLDTFSLHDGFMSVSTRVYNVMILDTERRRIETFVCTKAFVLKAL